MRPHLDEKTKRLWATTEIRALGRGGIILVHRATGIAVSTLRRALIHEPALLPKDASGTQGADANSRHKPTLLFLATWKRWWIP